MPTVTANDLTLYYEDTGRDAPPVVLVHAYLGRCDVWAGQRIHLANRYRVVAYDARGHGRTEAPADPDAYSLTAVVADLVGLLDALELDAAHLCGLSMGAETVLHMLLEHPDRVSSAVMADIGTGSDDPTLLARWADELADAFLTRGAEWTFDNHLYNSDLIAGLGLTRKKRMEGMRSLVLAQDPKAMAYMLRGALSRRPSVYSLGDRLRSVRCPVLVIRGEKDRPVEKPTRFLVDHIPDAREVVIPGVSHVTNIQAPSEFNRALATFLDDVTGKA